MYLKNSLKTYHNELDLIYGKNEVDSFFNILIGHYFELKRFQLVLNPEMVMSSENEKLLASALEQLKAEKPIQYIIGETEFYGLPFKVNAHTLIPRPETEELVEFIISNTRTERLNSKFNPEFSGLNSDIENENFKVFEPHSKSEVFQILDIGTGSGCIAVALAKIIKNAEVYALDISEEALKVAKQNGELNNVEINFIESDILNQANWNLDFALKYRDLTFDAIASNPPYVRQLEKKDMRANVLKNEPHLALFVKDENPLQFYKAICKFAKHYLKPKGQLYFEINEYLGNEMIDLLASYEFGNIELKKDRFGKDRMITGINNNVG